MPPRASAYPPIPGPLDRVGFFDEQRRHRRASRWYALLCIILVIVMCAVMSVLLAPILYSAIGLALDVLNLVMPMPDLLGPVWHAVEGAIDRLDSPGAGAALAALLVPGAIPGLLLLALLGFGLRRLFARAGVDGMLATMPVRPANPGDAQERQLLNVIEEIAIAARVAPPRVVLSDADGIDCGALGTGVDDAVLIVSRPMLDKLDRDETQGVIAHLIASIGNGDMRIGLWMLSVMQMLSALSLVIYAPVNREARRLLAMLLGLALGRSDKGDGQRLAGLLSNPFNGRHAGGPDDDASKWVVFATMPATIVDLIFSRMFNLFLLAPALGFAWRHRKYLADAGAVALTRQPDGLARALLHSLGESRAIPGGNWPAHLFVFDPRASAVVQETLDGAGRNAPASDSGPENISFSLIAARLSSAFGKPPAPGSTAALDQQAHRERLVAVMAAAHQDASGGASGPGSASAIGLLPSSKRRIRRLAAMGASVRLAERAVSGQWKLWLVLSPLFAALAVLVAALFVMGTQLVAMLSMLVIALPVGLLHLLIRGTGG